MRIDTVNIHFAAPSALSNALVNAVLAKTTEQSAAPNADVRTFVGAAPQVGEVWEGQGGIYAGITRGSLESPPCHLILASVEPDDKLAWQEAIDWARGLHHEGHSDWHVPTRFESALLYANLQERFDPKPWYWTSTQDSDAGYAWGQYFSYGNQDYDGKSSEGRVRAVRRFIA